MPRARLRLIRTPEGPAIRCRICGEVKPEAQFYPHHSYIGRRGQCIPCYIAQVVAGKLRRRQAVAS